MAASLIPARTRISISRQDNCLRNSLTPFPLVKTTHVYLSELSGSSLEKYLSRFPTSFTKSLCTHSTSAPASRSRIPSRPVISSVPIIPIRVPCKGRNAFPCKESAAVSPARKTAGDGGFSALIRAPMSASVPRITFSLYLVPLLISAAGSFGGLPDSISNSQIISTYCSPMRNIKVPSAFPRLSICSLR